MHHSFSRRAVLAVAAAITLGAGGGRFISRKKLIAQAATRVSPVRVRSWTKSGAVGRPAGFTSVSPWR